MRQIANTITVGLILFTAIGHAESLSLSGLGELKAKVLEQVQQLATNENRCIQIDADKSTLRYPLFNPQLWGRETFKDRYFLNLEITYSFCDSADQSQTGTIELMVRNSSCLAKNSPSYSGRLVKWVADKVDLPGLASYSARDVHFAAEGGSGLIYDLKETFASGDLGGGFSYRIVDLKTAQLDPKDSKWYLVADQSDEFLALSDVSKIDSAGCGK